MSAAVTTGLFTSITAVVLLFLQGWRERAKARDERLWGHQAETYVSLLQYRDTGMSDESMSTTKPEMRVRDELTAKAAAYASNEVWRLWKESASASVPLNEYVMEEWPELGHTPYPERFDIEERMEEDPVSSTPPGQGGCGRSAYQANPLRARLGP